MTKHQAELLESCSIIPMLVSELQLDTAEVVRRGLRDREKNNRSDEHIYLFVLFSIFFLILGQVLVILLPAFDVFNF